MSDDNTELDSELEEATDNAEAEAALGTEDETTDSLESIDLESDKESSREEQRKKSAEGQIKKAQTLLDKGEVLPESLKWTLKHLTPPEEQTGPKPVKADTVKAEIMDDLLFDKKQEEYKKLPKELKELVKSKYDKLRGRGFMKGEALSELLSIVQVKGETKSRKAASLPESSGSSFNASEFESMDNAKQIAYLKKLVSSNN